MLLKFTEKKKNKNRLDREYSVDLFFFFFTSKLYTIQYNTIQIQIQALLSLSSIPQLRSIKGVAPVHVLLVELDLVDILNNEISMLEKFVNPLDLIGRVV